MDKQPNAKEIMVKRAARALGVDEKKIWSQPMLETCIQILDYAEKQETLMGMWVRNEFK